MIIKDNAQSPTCLWCYWEWIKSTEPRVDEIIGHAREVRKHHIPSRGPNQFSLISRSMYVSLSAGIKNSKSFWSTGAMGLYVVSIVPSTDVCIGLCAKMSSSLLTDAISAAAYMLMGLLKSDWTKQGKYIPFYNFSGTLDLLRLWPPGAPLTTRLSCVFASPTSQISN